MKAILLNEVLRMPKPMQAEMITALGLDTLAYRQGEIQHQNGTCMSEEAIERIFTRYINENTESTLEDTMTLEKTYIVHASHFALSDGNDPIQCGIPDNELTLLVRTDEDDPCCCIDRHVSEAVAEMTGCLIDNYCQYVVVYVPYQDD